MPAPDSGSPSGQSTLDDYIVVRDNGTVYLGSDLEGAWFGNDESDAWCTSTYDVAYDRARALNDLFGATDVEGRCSVRSRPRA